MANGIRVKAVPSPNGQILLAPGDTSTRTKAADSAPVGTIRLVTEKQAQTAADQAEERRLAGLLREKGIAPGSFAERAFRLQHDRRPARPTPEVKPGSDLERLLRFTQGA